MNVGDTQQIYKRRKNTKDYLNKTSVGTKINIPPVPLCIVINQLPVDLETPFTFRTKTYKKYFYDVQLLTPQQEMELLIARFKFIANSIKHNLKLTTINGADFLQEDVKKQINKPILLNELRVASKIHYLNGSCDVKNLLIKVLDPDSNENINNIQSLTSVLNKIKAHKLCNDEMLNTLTSIYNNCVELSRNAVEAIRNDDISLDSLIASSISNDRNNKV